ncbi:MAG: hypothetical protein O2877_01520 [bacterium]|nr:hypothetical protein [bacterium]
MNKSLNLHLTAFLLTLASALHLVRSVAGWELSINNWIVPVWLSVVAFLLAGYLAVQMWKMAK